MTDEPTHDETAQNDDSKLGRRQFLQGATATIAGAAGLTAMSDDADAASNEKHLVVVGTGPGEHSYTVHMEDGATISKGDYGDGHDSAGKGFQGEVVASGTLWHWNVDDFTYTGEINFIEAEGSVGFHLPQGAFQNDTKIEVIGDGDGRHDYTIGGPSVDIDPISNTVEWNDEDLGAPRTERDNTPDYVSGTLRDTGRDSYSTNGGGPIQYLEVDDGTVIFQPESPSGSASFNTGTASLVMFYMGDSEFTTTFQETTPLHAAMDGYDEKVLLKHDIGVESIASTGAQNEADVVADPTRSNFERELQRLRNEGYTIDLYIFSHGYDQGAFRLSQGSHGSVDKYNTNDVRNLTNSIGDPLPLRMVYQVNCWGSEMNGAWRDAGAKAVAGSRYVNFYPHHFAAFATNWTSGQEFQTAIDNSSTPATRSVVQGALAFFDAPATNGDKWGNASGGCPMWQTVLGDNGCARDYYLNRWYHDPSEWSSFPNQPDGKANMNHASEKVVDGDATLTNSGYY